MTIYGACADSMVNSLFRERLLKYAATLRKHHDSRMLQEE